MPALVDGVVHTVCQASPKVAARHRLGRVSLEQVADMVLLLNRPDAHGHGESDRPGAADIVAKNRSGRVNRVAVGFQGHCCRFTPHG